MTDADSAGRIRTAQDDLVKALNGDLQAIDEINVQRKGSATSVGKKAFQASWDQLIAAGKVPADGVLSTAPIATMPKMLPAMSGLGELNTAQIVIIGIGLVVGLFVLPRIAKGR